MEGIRQGQTPEADSLWFFIVMIFATGSMKEAHIQLVWELRHATLMVRQPGSHGWLHGISRAQSVRLDVLLDGHPFLYLPKKFELSWFPLSKVGTFQVRLVSVGLTW
jgi:hypothetical protein